MCVVRVRVRVPVLGKSKAAHFRSICSCESSLTIVSASDFVYDCRHESPRLLTLACGKCCGSGNVAAVSWKCCVRAVQAMRANYGDCITQATEGVMEGVVVCCLRVCAVWGLYVCRVLCASAVCCVLCASAVCECYVRVLCVQG